MNATKNCHRPITGLYNLDRDLNKMFTEIFGNPMPTKQNETHWQPRADVAENEAQYLIEMDLAGLTKEHINIHFQDEILTVEGERIQAEKAEDTQYYRSERMYGKFNRTFRLPKPIQADQIKATFENGVLFLSIPKAEVAKPVTINIV